MKKDSWWYIKVFINARLNKVFKREDLIHCINDKPSRIDVYRRGLIVSGFIEHIGIGKYKVKKIIPIDTSFDDCKKSYKFNTTRLKGACSSVG